MIMDVDVRELLANLVGEVLRLVVHENDEHELVLWAATHRVRGCESSLADVEVLTTI